MKYQKIFILTLLFIIYNSKAGSQVATSGLEDLWGMLQPGKYSVGFKVLYSADPSRPFDTAVNNIMKDRPVRLMIWYPAGSGRAGNSINKVSNFGDYFNVLPTDTVFSSYNRILQARDINTLNRQFSCPDSLLYVDRLKLVPIHAVMNAAPASGKFPVILYSLGRNNFQQENTILCEYLASNGYMVVNVPQMGPSVTDQRLSFSLKAMLLQEKDMAFALEKIKDMPNLDRDKIIVMGHSSGGVASLLYAAGNKDVDAVISLDGSITGKDGLALIRESGINISTVHVPILNLYKTLPPSDFPMLDTFAMSDRYNFAFKKATHFDFQNWPVYLRVNSFEDPRSIGFRTTQEGNETYYMVCGVIKVFLDRLFTKTLSSVNWPTHPLVEFSFRKKSDN